MTTVGELKALKGLKLVHMNCRSILNKIDEVSYIYDDIDILACTETWLHKAIPNYMVDIASMHLYRHDRVSSPIDGSIKSRGGGVACYIRKDLKIITNVVPSCSQISEHIEVLTLKCICAFGKIIYIMIVYRPPNGSYQEFLDKLTMFIENGLLNNSELYICGDFNIDFLQWNSPKTKSLITFLRSHGLKQHIKAATRLTGFSRTCIDYIITNIPDARIVASGVLCEVISDHFPIFICVKKRRNHAE